MPITEPMTYAPAADDARSRARRRLPRAGLLALVMLAFGGGAFGSWASFSASTTNSATFATGVLILSNKVESGTTCVSASGNTDGNATDCDALVSINTQKPGNTATTAKVVLQNVGSITGSTLQAYASSACATDNTAGSFHGTGDLCALVQLTIQSYVDQASLDADTPAGGVCAYGVDTTPADGVCDGYSSTRTLAHFSTTYPAFGSSLSLGSLGGSAFRYYRVGVKLDPTAGNTIQGRRATFGITWRLAQ